MMSMNAAAATERFAVMLGERVTQPPTAAQLEHVAAKETLFDDADVEWYDAASHDIVLTREATSRLFASIDPPKGTYPEAEGRLFTVVIGERTLTAGVVISPMTLYNMPSLDCPALYPATLPAIIDGHLAFAIGRPHLGEEGTKRWVEEGPEAAFQAIPLPELEKHFAAAGKLKRK
jgi:hypothetical protein